ncbi:MAG TPA: hypothetical protein VGR14_08070 [Verrucomicrobiae bacterium]|nr:hypothetical protein [Verrucomicrobiae bacterium]
MAFLSVFTLRSRGGDTSPAATNIISGNESLWTQSMLWDQQATLSSGLGYKDNIFLSAFNPRNSAFVVNGLDWMVLRLPLDGWKVVGLIDGDDTRFWRNVGTNSEDLFISSLRIQRELPDGWQAGLECRGLYEKQVLDISTSSGAPATALVEGYGITAQPSVRKDFKNGLWLQVEMPLTRWLLQSPLDDYSEFGPVVTVGDDFGRSSTVTVSYGASYQDHSGWVALDRFGRPLPQHLEIFQDRTELAWNQYWDSHRHLRSSTRFIFAYDQDNGGGYFNFDQYQIVEDLRWQTPDWQVKGTVQQIYELYPVQGVGILNGQLLNRNFLDLSLEVERRLYKHLKGFGKVQYQRGHSNYADDSGDYTARTYSGGLRWEF